MIGKFIQAWLLAQSEITALVGTGTSARIRAGAAPQGWAFPRVTYQVVSDGINTSGLSSVGTVATARVQIDLWGQGPAGYGQVHTMADAVRGSKASGTQGTRLDGYRGGDYAGIFVQGCKLAEAGQTDSTEAPDDGSDNAIHNVSLDFVINYER